MSKIGCVAVVKNEARHIAEWLAWQFVLGFDTVFLLDNGSTDATAAIAGGFAPQYDVRVIDYPNNARDYQMRGYEMLARQVAGEYEWLAFFDADEFLRLDDDLTLKALLAARPEAAIAVPWAIFGSSGHQDIPPGLLVENFTRRSHWDFPPNAHVKSIIRPELMEAALNPHAFQVRGDYVDLLGRPVVWSSSGVRTRPSDCAGGALNHYFVRSAAHWAEKLKRGYNDLTRKAEEFKDYDRNEVEDKRLAGQAGQIREILSRINPPLHEFAICACARWETRYITEWLSYYREIGFSHVYLYCNDDNPGEMYQQVLPFLQGDAPFVTFHHHPHQGQQFEMYAHFVRNHLAETEWASFFDIDEFLRLPPGETIGDFMQRFPADVESVLFNWFNFGPNGHKTPPNGPVLETFTRREEKIHPFTKFVTRSASMAGILAVPRPRVHGFWHTVSDKFDHPVKTVNVLGEDAAEYYTEFPDRAVESLADPARSERLFAMAGVHHYRFRSEHAYTERATRGLGGDFQGQIAWKQAAESPDFAGLLAAMNAVEDTSLANFWAARRQRAQSYSTAAAQRLVRPQTISGAKSFRLTNSSAAVSPGGGAKRIGIAITTLNRRELILAQVEKIRASTLAPFDLVVCDDGSTDGTVAALRARGVAVVSGTRRGIAWNKNRGIYYLMNASHCDTILLIDDDMAPMVQGWEQEWIASANIHGHVNYIHSTEVSFLSSSHLFVGQRESNRHRHRQKDHRQLDDDASDDRNRERLLHLVTR
ncbi:MAG: glycosyltransferase family 2 protein, partial [Rhodospirillales bacterium]|nr:glycosyltransferase family 2 protein [Rhodospirillales bacterium]